MQYDVIQVMTADGASIELGAEVYYCVKDAVQSVNNIRDLNHSTRLIARTSLQTHCGRHNLDHVEASRNKICSQLEVSQSQQDMLPARSKAVAAMYTPS